MGQSVQCGVLRSRSSCSPVSLSIICHPGPRPPSDTVMGPVRYGALVHLYWYFPFEYADKVFWRCLHSVSKHPSIQASKLPPLLEAVFCAAVAVAGPKSWSTPRYVDDRVIQFWRRCQKLWSLFFFLSSMQNAHLQIAYLQYYERAPTEEKHRHIEIYAFIVTVG